MPLFPEWQSEIRSLSARRFEDQRREWIRGTTTPDTADRLTRSLALYDADPATHLSLAQAGVDPERDAGVWARFQAASQVYSSSRGALVGNRGPAGELVNPGGVRPIYRSTGPGSEELVGFTGLEPGDGERLARIVSLLTESLPTGHGARNAETIGTGHGSRGAVRRGKPVLTGEALLRGIEYGSVDVADLLELDGEVLQRQGEQLAPPEKPSGGGNPVSRFFGAVGDTVGKLNPVPGLLGLSQGPASAQSPLVASGGGSQANPLFTTDSLLGSITSEAMERVAQGWQSAMSMAPVDDILEPAVNVGVQVLDFPYQLTQAVARSAYRDWNRDGFGMFLEGGTFALTPERLEDVGLQTGLGVMAYDIGEEFNPSGERLVGEGVNIGEGYFYGGAGEEFRDDYARGVAEIGGQTFTIGRYLAAPFDAGTRPHTILSGLIDATLAVAGPGDIALGSAFSHLAASRQLRSMAPAYLELGDALAAADNAEDVARLLGPGVSLGDESLALIAGAPSRDAVNVAIQQIGLESVNLRGRVVDRLGDLLSFTQDPRSIRRLLDDADISDEAMDALRRAGSWDQVEGALQRAGLEADLMSEVTPSRAAMLRQEWGALTGSMRATVDPGAAQFYLDSRAGQRRIRQLAATSDTAVVDRMTGRVLQPERIRMYADASDPAEIRALLDDDLGLRIAGRLDGPFRRPFALRSDVDFVPAPSRALHDVPTGAIDAADGRRFLDQMENWFANTGVSGRTRSRWHDRLVRAEGQQERFAAVSQFFVETAVRSQMRGWGLAQDVTAEAAQARRFRLSAGADDIMPGLREFVEASGLDPEDALDEVLERLVRRESVITGDAAVDNRLRAMLENTQKMWRLFDEERAVGSIYAINYNAGSIEEAARGLTVRIGDEIVEMPPEVVHLHNETLHRAIPVPDPRMLRRHFSNYRGILLTPAGELRVSSKVYNAMLGLQSSIWKPAVLARLAWPVRVVGEEQLRLAAGGYTSLAWHPVQHIAATLGDGRRSRLERWLSRVGDRVGYDPFTATREHFGTFAGDLLGERFAAIEDFQGALSAHPRARGMHFDGREIIDTRVIRAGNKPGEAFEAWGDVISQVAYDPVSQLVLRSSSLDEAKEAFWVQFGDVRRDLVASQSVSGDWARLYDLRTRRGADTYIETLNARINEVVRGNGDLRDAMRNRSLNGAPMGRGTAVSPEFLGKLESFGDSMPDFLPRWRPRSPSRWWDQGERFGEQVVESMFTLLMGVPTNRLSRSPVFREEYWNEVVSIVPRMDRAELPGVLQNAEKANIPRSLQEQIRRAAGSARADVALSAEEVDLLAKGVALDRTQDLLFDISRRNQFFDAAALLFPFGDAWAEVLTRWASLVKDNPMVVRRAEQVLEAGRSPDVGEALGAQGPIFHEDGEGNEVFSYPMPWVNALPGHNGVPFSGKLSGLSLVSEVWPGLGPLAQIPVAIALPDTSEWNWLRNIAFPYGEPNVEVDMEALLERDWANVLGDSDNLLQVGYEEWFPAHVRRIIGSLSGKGFSEDERRQYVTQFSYLFAQLGEERFAHGELEAMTPDQARDAVAQIREEAHEITAGLTLARGMAPVIGGMPAAPSPEWYFDDPSGMRVHLSALRDAWRATFEDAPPGEDPTLAVQRFVDKYGAWSLLAVQGKSVSRYFGSGVPPTATAEKWVEDNGSFVSEFELVAGYFAPGRGEDLDWDAWRRQWNEEDRVALSEDEILSRYFHTIGSLDYARYKEASLRNWEEAGYDVSGVLPLQLRRDLADYDQELIAKWGGIIGTSGYQGRSSSWLGPSSGNRDAAEQALREAIADDAVAETPLAEALNSFFVELDAMTENFRAWDEGTSTDWREASQGYWVRDYIVEVADELIRTVPGFDLVWEEVFEPSMSAGFEKDAEEAEEE